ncbi:disulfide bond formation protein B [Pseudomonas huanghezhanensis]|uniref:disulfide bond formation protein B n=1 Tax=Pseudomonas huanghezhanensis TaxID=3002903 RepID=UPI002285B43E|nr:disulfide bond formation protein B [Pseudomonas sp. BSw22131]
MAFVSCALCLGAAFYFDMRLGPSLSPFCLVQRGLYVAYGVLCLLAVVHAPRISGWRVYAGLMLIISISGALIAGRQVFLQAFAPDDIVACQANLQFMLDTQPFLKVLGMVLSGNIGCAEITWSFFGISIPEWSLLAFTGLGVFALRHVFIGLRWLGATASGAED